MKEVKNSLIQAENGAKVMDALREELMPGRPTWTPTQDPTPRPEHYQPPKRRRVHTKYKLGNYPL